MGSLKPKSRKSPQRTTFRSAPANTGRFAMIETFSGDGGLGFSLVPWQSVLDKRIGLAPKPTWNSVSLTHIQCRMLASLRATAVIAHNMLDRLAIRRPHARNADHFLIRGMVIAKIGSLRSSSSRMRAS
jgi:hypothetical protein